MFEDEKIKLIDAMPERDTIHYIWIRLLVQAGKTNSNGFIFLNENIPYTEEMLSTIFCRPLTSIRLALKTLKDFGMIEIDEDNLIKISNWDKHQNVQGMERVREQTKRRVENHRVRKKQIEQPNKDNGQEIIEEGKDNKITEENFNKNPNNYEINEDSFVQNLKENNCNATESNCNVTNNESNATITEQNKRESKNKKENKIKIKIKKESESNNIGDINKKDLSSQETENFNHTHFQNSNMECKSITQSNSNTQATELLKYYEQITGVPNVLNVGAIKLAISMHGKKYVKMAIDRALEVNKADMTYINGILKNWRREGYPKEKEVINNGVRSNGKSNTADKNEFGNFKAKKPRSLTESQRKGTEEELI